MAAKACELGTEVAAGARAVLDDHGLAPLRAELLGQQARQSVAAAAGLERDDDADGRSGVVLGVKRDREGEETQKEGRSFMDIVVK